MDKSLVDLSKYRLSQAKQCIKSAKLLAENDDYKGAANRSYYAIFHAMRSVLALEQIDFSSPNLMLNLGDTIIKHSS